MNQTLKVIPSGFIESGSVTIAADPVTGIVTFEGDVEAGIGWFSKDYPGSGTLKVDSSLLLSKNIKIGQEFTFPSITVQISDIKDGTASANVTVASADATLKGVAELDLSGEYFQFVHILLSGQAEGEDVTVELTGGN